MNRISTLFNSKKSNILSIYFTAGYPQLEDTLPVLKALQEKGIDMIEIGIPFSDPMADGPVIQEASAQALRNGMSLRLLFDQLKEVRKEIHIPLIFMGYLNPIMQYGFEAFCRKCAATGIDGVIIPDLPCANYIIEYKPIADRYNIKVIMLITPETSDERVRLIDRHTNGFIYMASSAETTGTQQNTDEHKQSYYHRINAMNLQNPHLLGFDISNKNTLDTAIANSSGAVIESKFVELLSSEKGIEKAANRLMEVLNL